jgi:hypothetical protein
MPIILNNIEITDEQVFREMQHHPAKNHEVAMQLAAEALTIREILLQEAVAMGIAEKYEQSEDEPLADDERIQKLLDEVIKIPELDEASCRRFHENNLQKFTKSGVESEFDEVKSVIAEYLHNTSWQTAVQQYIKILVGKAKIAGIEIEGVDNPLVQ